MEFSFQYERSKMEFNSRHERSKVEFSFQHERKRMRSMTEFDDGKRLLPKPKPSVVLPFDAMVSILIRLPPRHLRRMRSVCRSWSLLISNNHFIKEHSKFRASVIRRPYIVSVYRRTRLFPEGDDYHLECGMIGLSVGAQFCAMSNSCDGLIYVVGQTFTYLVNPSIQKVRALMRRFWHFTMTAIHSVGLGFDHSTGEYKVVRMFHRKEGVHQHFGCEVYTVGSSCWKVIDNPPLEPSRYNLPVFVNGAIHWTVNTHPEHLIFSNEVPPEIALSFDVKSERFHVILHPEGSSRPPCSRVVELGGLLCLACTHCDRMQMDIWVLKDYNNRKWIKQHNIDLSAMHGYCISLGFWTKPVAIHDGKIVFCNQNGSRDYYDPQSKTFVKHIHVSTGYVLGIAYTESIVWPTTRITTSPRLPS